MVARGKNKSPARCGEASIFRKGLISGHLCTVSGFPYSRCRLSHFPANRCANGLPLGVFPLCRVSQGRTVGGDALIRSFRSRLAGTEANVIIFNLTSEKIPTPTAINGIAAVPADSSS